MSIWGPSTHEFASILSYITESILTSIYWGPTGKRRSKSEGKYPGLAEWRKEGGVSEQLGLELRRIREERGLTVEDLAQKSGISVTTVRAVERGTREARGDTVAKLAKPLGLTFDDVWRLQRRWG
jgi:DNA-binding XRE family transcriptional regulator